MKLKGFATDENAEVNGRWFDLSDTVKVKVARFGNKEHEEAKRRLQEPYLVQIRNGTLSSDKNEELSVRAMAETILLDWEGIEDVDGNPVEYSQDAAYQALLDNRDFRDMISMLAADSAAYREERQEEAEKN